MNTLRFPDWYSNLVEGALARWSEITGRVKAAKAAREPRTVDAAAWVEVVLRERGLAFGAPLPDPAIDPEAAAESEAHRWLLVALRHQIEIALEISELVLRLPHTKERLHFDVLLLFAHLHDEDMLADRIRRDMKGGRAVQARRLGRQLGDVIRSRWEANTALPTPVRTGLLVDETRRLAAAAGEYFDRGGLSDSEHARLVQLDQSALLALIEALSGMAWADGEMSPEEQALIEDRLKTVRLDGGARRKAIRAIYSPRTPEQIAEEVDDPAIRRFILEQVILQSHADGVVVDSEADYLNELAQRFGMADAEVAEAVAHVAAFCERNMALVSTAPGGDPMRSLHRSTFDTIRGQLRTDHAELDRVIAGDPWLHGWMVALRAGHVPDEVTRDEIERRLIEVCMGVEMLAPFAEHARELLAAVVVDELGATG